jgi:exodeoxyribonuclease VII large subunit
MSTSTARPAGIPGSALTGPWPVGQYAHALRERLRQMARVQLFGEVWNLRTARTRVWFELRDARGALPCSMWRTDWEGLGLPAGAVRDGAQVVVAGGCDYYPGSGTASPAFSFAVADLRLAGEGDLLAQLDRLRKLLHAEGLPARQARLARPALPRCIGVVTGEGGKARDDVLAGLRRRGWAGRIVWAFAPVQDRQAAPRITRALTDLAALPEVEVVVVARGGGSLADLFCFCDEALCRTVALLRVPVIASVGHHTDRTLLDEVAAVSCSTPTHAAEAAVPLHCDEARAGLVRAARALDRGGRRAVVDRARRLQALARAPGEHVAGQRRRLHQQLREVRAAARRRVADERAGVRREAVALERRARALQGERARARAELGARTGQLQRAAGAGRARQARDLERLALALAAHDPQRTLARGYAMVTDPAGRLLTTTGAARRAGEVTLRLADGEVDAEVRG